MSQRLRIALIGCGSFAHRHVRSLQTLRDDFEMVAFCNRSVEKAKNFSIEYTADRAPVFTDHQEMFEQVPLDAVVITLPPYAHTDQVAFAAQRGIHVFIEKPIALTSDQAWSMVRAAEDNGIVTQVGFMFRFGEAVERLKGMIISGEAGLMGLMSARYFCNSLHADWWQRRDKSGGQLVEQAIHMVDLMRYLMGEAVTVYSRQENLFHRDLPDYTIEDVSATVFRFESGALGVLYATNGAIPDRWISDCQMVSRHLTAVFADANTATFTFTSQPGVPTETVAGKRDVYLHEMKDFLRAIRTGGEARTPMREGARTLDLALAANRSAQTGRESPNLSHSAIS
jgi:predicted dehydrogenase